VIPLVLIDATAIPADRGGVGRYVDGLVAALNDAHLVVVCQARDAEHFSEIAPASRIEPVHGIGSPIRRLLWEQLGLPRVARRLGVAVIHSPHYTMPLIARRPVVVTLHDATFFSDPHLHGRLKRVFFRTWTRVSARRAAGLLVPSAATAREVGAHVRLDPTRVTVAFHGVDTATFRPATPDAIQRLASTIGQPEWIAFLGSLEPRKNLPELVAAYADVRRDRDARGLDTPVLALAGAQAWETRLDAVIASHGLGDQVLKLGYLPLGDLAAFLGGSVVTVYPSLGEGFGLPVLEAMASGAAVLTTRRLALPEVGGDAVAYAETDAASLAHELGLLLDSPDRRNRLRAAGLERAAGFTWAASADAHRDAYRAANGA
jgi:glycosyltransferase involved in cell wall biosynthesis